jgi:NMD protein affecting ribosome stability and mRNA decay
MEKTIRIQLKLLTNKPDKMTVEEIKKALDKLFMKDPVLKRYTLVDVTKLKLTLPSNYEVK